VNINLMLLVLILKNLFDISLDYSDKCYSRCVFRRV